MKSIVTMCLIVGLLSCKTKEVPVPGIQPIDFVGAYQFTGIITYSESTDGYSGRVVRKADVSGKFQVTTFGTGTAIQIVETSADPEVNKRYQASPATQKMVSLYTADKSLSNAELSGSIYLINEKEISLTRTVTSKYGDKNYRTEISLRGTKL